jgi:hypothetical protein
MSSRCWSMPDYLRLPLSRPPLEMPLSLWGNLTARGTIEVGKTADLVLLDNDPLADTHNTRSIQAVVLSGKLYARAALDAMLVKAQTITSSQDASASGK